MNRLVLPEYLDALPHDHAEAEANRRELRLFNFYLGTNRWFVRELGTRVRAGDRILEIGAGEGILTRALQQRVGKGVETEISWSALDRSPVFRDPQGPIAFVMADLLEYDAYGGADVIIGNMILHQFTDTELRRIGDKLSRTARVLVFQETLRQPFHYGLCQIATIPMSRVSRHDAAVSIRAGFRRDELPRSLGLDGGAWTWKTQSTLRGAYRMIAFRR